VNGRRRLLGALLGGLIARPRRVAAAVDAHVVQRQEVWLGRTSVQLVVSEREPGGLTFVSLHENERTAVQAARQLIDHHPGRLVELRSRGARLVTFWLGATPHVFDPNRIFTEVGIEKTLRHYGSFSRPAQSAIGPLREAILALLPTRREQPLVAVHNNQEGAYSIAQYRSGGPYSADAEVVVEAPGRSPGDFFLVTNRSWFERLRQAGFSVVLQSRTPTDDGSLSVWCQQRDQPYVNVEARYGVLEEQHRMLQSVADLARRDRR
jgi:hypothetical protein